MHACILVWYVKVITSDCLQVWINVDKNSCVQVCVYDNIFVYISVLRVWRACAPMCVCFTRVDVCSRMGTHSHTHTYQHVSLTSSAEIPHREKLTDQGIPVTTH